MSLKNILMMREKYMNDIILYGAFDRHNYGDLLFPLIMERVIKQQFPEKKVVVAGLIDSDLSEFGAPKTVKIKQALKESQHDATVMLAGGDVVACDWQSAYGYLLPTIIFPFYERIACYYFPKITDFFIARLAGLTSELPFNLNRDDVGISRKIIYNSVGATGVSHVIDENKMLSLSKVMNEACYVAVRDVFSQEQLKRLHISRLKNLSSNHHLALKNYSKTTWKAILFFKYRKRMSEVKSKHLLMRYQK
mgnify:CR=1 FL=1